MSGFNKDDYLAGMDDVEKLRHAAGSDSTAGAAAGSADSAAGSAAGAADQAGSADSAGTGATSGTASADSADSTPAAGDSFGSPPAGGSDDSGASGDTGAGEAEDFKSAASSADDATASGADSDDKKDDGDDLTPLGKAKKEAADYLEALQRERAEFVNFRNRANKEQDRFRQHGIIDVLTALLPALDDLDRIREHGEMTDDLTAVANKLDRAFEKFGVEKFGEKGEDFDPTKHEAILHKPDAEATKESVDTVVEAGYKVGDRVVRAARVVVASPTDAN